MWMIWGSLSEYLYAVTVWGWGEAGLLGEGGEETEVLRFV